MPFILPQECVQEGYNRENHLEQVTISLASLRLEAPAASLDDSMDYDADADEYEVLSDDDLDLSEELLDDPSEPDTVFKDMGRINQANIVSGTRTRNTQEEALIEQLGRLGITMEIEEKEKNATSELSTYKDWAYCDEQYRKMQEKRRRRFEDLEAAAKEDPKSLDDGERDWEDRRKRRGARPINKRGGGRSMTRLPTKAGDNKGPNNHGRIEKKRGGIVTRELQRLAQVLRGNEEANTGREAMAVRSLIAHISAMEVNGA